MELEDFPIIKMLSDMNLPQIIEHFDGLIKEANTGNAEKKYELALTLHQGARQIPCDFGHLYDPEKFGTTILKTYEQAHEMFVDLAAAGHTYGREMAAYDQMMGYGCKQDVETARAELQALVEEGESQSAGQFLSYLDSLQEQGKKPEGRPVSCGVKNTP